MSTLFETKTPIPKQNNQYVFLIAFIATIGGFLFGYDLSPLKAGFRAADVATSLAGDGVHPTLYGNAMLGAFIAVEAQKVLSRTH